MVQDYPLHDTLSVLRNSGLVVFPTDTLWSIGADASDPVGVLRLLRLFNQAANPQPLEILVDSLDMLKHYVHRLHPRLETLLLYHTQPLTIQVDRIQNLPIQLTEEQQLVAFRLVQDEYSRQLIGALGKPIVSMFATFNGHHLPSHFGSINSDVFSATDLVVGMDISSRIPGKASVMVRLSDDDELEFLRE